MFTTVRTATARRAMDSNMKRVDAIIDRMANIAKRDTAATFTAIRNMTAKTVVAIRATVFAARAPFARHTS